MSKINFNTYKNTVVGGEELQSDPRSSIVTDKDHNVKTVQISRKIRGTLDNKRKLIERHDSRPFGYVGC